MSHRLGLRTGKAALNPTSQNDADGKPVEDVFVVPYQRNPQLFGRETFLQTINDQLNTQVERQFNHRLALHGMGGVGKSQCALEYVYSNKDNYKRIYWISAVDQASLLSGYQKIAKKASLPGLESASPGEIAEAVLSWLRREENWLVVIDNLDDINVAHGLLPENGPTKHTLITTRNPHATKIPAEPLEVPVLDAETSVDLFTTVSKVQIDSIKKAQVAEIVKELGYLPLAISQAAAYVREVTGDLGDYMEEYYRNRAKVHQWKTDNADYPLSLAASLSLSFKILQSSQPRAFRLLQLFSFLTPDRILIEFLRDGAKALDKELQQILSDRTETAAIFIELERFSLIKWDRLHKSISMHRLIQAVLLDNMSDEESTATLNTMIAMFVQVFPEDVTNENRRRYRIYESQVVEPLLRHPLNYSQKSAEIRVRIGEHLFVEGKNDDSEILLEQALALYTVSFSEDHYLILTIMNFLASIYLDRKDISAAEAMAYKVMDYYKQYLPNEVKAIGQVITIMSLISLSQGTQDEAIGMLERTLRKCKENIGEDNPTVIGFMATLARLYMDDDRLEEAEKLFEKVMDCGRSWAAKPDYFAKAMQSLVVIYIRQGRLNDAIRLEGEALTEFKVGMGEEHPSTISCMKNLAFIHELLGNFTEAMTLEKEALVEETRSTYRGGDYYCPDFRSYFNGCNVPA